MASADSSKFSGAGVLIVDRKSSSLLLIQDYSDDYNCCGGFIKSYDDPNSIEKTACEELSEETRTLIKCDVKSLLTCPFVDLNGNDNIFRCFVLKMKCESDICQQFISFDVDTLPSDDDYRETTSMALFPLKQFKVPKSLAEIDQTSTAIDKKGNVKILNRRVISVIKAAIEKKVL